MYGKVGAKVKVLGEAYSEDDDEDMAFVDVTSIAVPGPFAVNL
jgi:hypothetical protein